MNNNMNENTKVTKDAENVEVVETTTTKNVEETKATETTTKNVEETKATDATKAMRERMAMWEMKTTDATKVMRETNTMETATENVDEIEVRRYFEIPSVDDITKEDVDENEVSDLMDIINIRNKFECGNHFVKDELSLLRNRRCDVFFKIRDIIYNDIIAKHNILCMTQSEYYAEILDKYKITDMMIRSINIETFITTEFTDDYLVHAYHQYDSTIPKSDIDYKMLRGKEIIPIMFDDYVELCRGLRPMVIKEELDMLIYHSLKSFKPDPDCQLLFYDFINANFEALFISRLEEDIELVIRYTNARIQVLRECCDNVLKVGEDYENEDKRYCFYQNWFWNLGDYCYGKSRSIIHVIYRMHRIIEHPLSHDDIDKMIQKNKRNVFVKLILEKCNFTDYEFYRYLYFTNFNDVIVRTGINFIKMKVPRKYWENCFTTLYNIEKYLKEMIEKTEETES